MKHNLEYGTLMAKTEDQEKRLSRLEVYVEQTNKAITEIKDDLKQLLLKSGK